MQDFRDVYIDRLDIKSALTGSLPGDKPLLEELGINFQTIKTELKLLLNPEKDFDHSDVTGPIIFTVLYSLLLFFSGKMHFGYVYFITLTSNFLLYFLVNVLKASSNSADFVFCFSVFGYSFVPIVVHAFISLIYKSKILGALSVAWSVYIASNVFCKKLEMERMRWIVGYPIMLVYVCYLLMTIY